MYRIQILLITLFSTLFVHAQVTTEPAFPTANQSVKVIFDATLGSAGLIDYTGDIYAHTGVITDKSTSSSDWKYVIANWSTNLEKAKLTRKSANMYELEITPNVSSFYGVSAGDKIEKLAFVFRNADGSKTGKASGEKDIFIDVSEGGLELEITSPANNSIFTISELVSISASSSVEANLKLFLNENLLSETTGTSISYDHAFSESGTYMIYAEATSTDTTVRDSISVSVRPETTEEPKPQGYKKGINYTSDNDAALVLWAPLKEFVYVIGDFNNWQISNDYLMKKDGDSFWLDISNLEAGKEYAYQYLIDGEIKIADPYTEKILDPWNDSYIQETTYPNLKPYPQNQTKGIVSILQTAQEEYNWEVADFQSTAKEKMVIYELLIRDFTEEHTYTSVIEKLDYLGNLNINVLELMPINEFEGNSSWGYNPSFYFAPDKYYGPKNELKRLIDECHKRGIAVVIDMVLNHSYGQSPFAQMYWNDTGNRPSAANPWYNQESNFKNPDAQWGYDFNHESQHTKELVDSVNSFWMENYKVDGFRFDFTKGFSNTEWTSSSWGSTYDAPRIANLKRMADEIWHRNDDALVIFEHLSDNPEEKELANHGIMLWGNINHNYNEAAMGYTENNKSDLSWGVFSKRGWSEPNLVSYMESHDEERIMYKNLQYGNSSGSYSIKQLSTALDRMELNSVFYIPIPGPKMIWQFGERGYDVSIDEGGRLGEKPPHWEYMDETDREDLYELMSNLNKLKQNYDEFSPDNAAYSLTSKTKWYKLSKGNNHVVGLGNFDVQQNNIAITFPTTGKYYEFFTNDSIEITSTSQTYSFNAGEYRLYSTRNFNDSRIPTTISDIPVNNADILVYPNPTNSMVNITSKEIINKIEIYSLAGELLIHKIPEACSSEININELTSGIYLTNVYLNNSFVSIKLLVN